MAAPSTVGERPSALEVCLVEGELQGRMSQARCPDTPGEFKLCGLAAEGQVIREDR